MARPCRSKFPRLVTSGRYRYFDEAALECAYYWCLPEDTPGSPFSDMLHRAGVLPHKDEHLCGLVIIVLLAAHFEWVREDAPRFADAGFVSVFEVNRRLNRFALHPVDVDDLPDSGFYLALYEAGVIDIPHSGGIRISRLCLLAVLLLMAEIVASDLSESPDRLESPDG